MGNDMQQKYPSRLEKGMLRFMVSALNLLASWVVKQSLVKSGLQGLKRLCLKPV